MSPLTLNLIIIYITFSSIFADPGDDFGAYVLCEKVIRSLFMLFIFSTVFADTDDFYGGAY